MTQLKRLRTQAFQKQEGRCYYCNLPMWVGSPPPLDAVGGRRYFASPGLRCTAEHLVAKCDGGKNLPDNIAAACEFCNRRRHRRKCALPPEAFRALVVSRMNRGKWHGTRL